MQLYFTSPGGRDQRGSVVQTILDFSFARCYSDFLYTKFSSSEHRRARAMTLLNALQGRLGTDDFFAILRDHGDISSGSFCPDQGLFQSQISLS